MEEEHAEQEVAVEEKAPPVPLTKEVCSSKLSGLHRTRNGLSYAYTKLDISGLNVGDIDALSTFDHLRLLEAENNRITNVGVLKNLPSLIRANLTKNEVESLESFPSLEYLQELYMAENNVDAIPSTLKLRNLRFADFNKNKISNIAGVESLEALTKLLVEGNALASLEGVASSSLTVLKAAGNKLENLKGVAGVPSLVEADFSSNVITSLEGVEGVLSKLTTLLLAGNKVESLDEVKRLQVLGALKVLDLSENPVTEQEGYRAQVLRLMPALVEIDRTPVSDEDRAEVERIEEEERAAAEAAAAEAEGGEEE
eukprot:CAMPEP_0113892148 /NCGR_PEP_ID=MMETSP0780_2-20120614/15232_1 /TAXON_ID=652834 /ORGANISM="Palpitomonas bilix" /LENGTH=312 /DNA_ID=CAMNT_0000882007 /DNA_START=178 /DNA_END=1116 /DNA_ORIENTATION=- /assembly_acc=CAM_ASM_000599